LAAWAHILVDPSYDEKKIQRRKIPANGKSGRMYDRRLSDLGQEVFGSKSSDRIGVQDFFTAVFVTIRV